MSRFYFHTQISVLHKINTAYNLTLAKKNYNEALCKLSQTALPIYLNPTIKYHLILSLSKQQWWNTIINSLEHSIQSTEKGKCLF